MARGASVAERAVPEASEEEIGQCTRPESAARDGAPRMEWTEFLKAGVESLRKAGVNLYYRKAMVHDAYLLLGLCGEPHRRALLYPFALE